MRFKRRRPSDEARDADAQREQEGADDTDDAIGDTTDDATDADAGQSDDAVDEASGADERSTTGPFDVADVDGPQDRLDVGALWLPLLEGAELQLQMEEDTGTVTGAFVVLGESAVQLQAFAAPRHEGIWAEICDEIAVGIAEQGGTADPGEGPFGRELLARVPAQQPDGKVGFQPLRFVGVDGPRWLLRAVFHGRAAVDPAGASTLEDLVRAVVVVRGGEPMGPRELLPLRLPANVVPEELDEELDEPDEEAEVAAADDLKPFERGPEITERR